MKPPPFEYASARSVDHAVELLAGGPDARILAGGQSLLPLLNLRLAAPELLIDIGRIAELQKITVSETPEVAVSETPEDTVSETPEVAVSETPEEAVSETGEETGAESSHGDGALTIGAGVNQSDAALNPGLRTGWPMLAAAIGHIGHPQIRNRGTVCGSLAHNDPLAELPAVAVALGASLVVRSAAGERTIAAPDMFIGPFMTALEPDELLVGVRFPPSPAGSGWSFREFAARDGDFATAGVATMLTNVDGAVADVRVVLFGVGGSPLRSTVVEQAVVGSTRPVIDGGLQAELAQALDPPDDIHASAATRRDLAVTLVTESVAEAWERTR